MQTLCSTSETEIMNMGFRSLALASLAVAKDQKYWKQSIAVHFGIAVVTTATIWVTSRSTPTEKFEFEVIELSNATKAFSVADPSIKKIEMKKPQPEKRAVYGRSKKSITADSADAPDLKIGNTLAKEIDSQKLNSTDDDLPIPVDEISVSKMPQVLEEIRIPYPPEAKKNGVSGAVITELLIDKTGKVRQIQLIQGLGFGCDEAAIEALKRFRFRPAEVLGADGNPEKVAVKIRYAYRFVLD
jgi:protein TonB